MGTSVNHLSVFTMLRARCCAPMSRVDALLPGDSSSLLKGRPFGPAASGARGSCLTLLSKNGQEVLRQGSGLGVTGASPAQQVPGSPVSSAHFPFATSGGF